MAGTGYCGQLSPEQAAALAELRQSMGELLEHPRWTDTLLLRFLRAKQFDVALAGEALEKHLAFRERHGLDGPSHGNPFGLGPAALAFPEMGAMKRCYPHAFHKTDRLGRPLYIERLGQLDANGLLEAVAPERILEYFAYESERQTTCRLPACSLAAGRLLESTMTVLDMEGFGFRTATNRAALNVVRSIMREQDENFPEVTGNLLIVNAPTAFSMVWSVVKPMLSASTTEKIEIFRAGGTAGHERLLELVAPENLPDFLGGTCTCDDYDGGCMHSDAGPWSEEHIRKELEETPYWEILRRLTPSSQVPGVGEPEADAAEEVSGAVEESADLEAHGEAKDEAGESANDLAPDQHIASGDPVSPAAVLATEPAAALEGKAANEIATASPRATPGGTGDSEAPQVAPSKLAELAPCKDPGPADDLDPFLIAPSMLEASSRLEEAGQVSAPLEVGLHENEEEEVQELQAGSDVPEPSAGHEEAASPAQAEGMAAHHLQASMTRLEASEPLFPALAAALREAPSEPPIDVEDTVEDAATAEAGAETGASSPCEKVDSSNFSSLVGGSPVHRQPHPAFLAATEPTTDLSWGPALVGQQVTLGDRTLLLPVTARVPPPSSRDNINQSTEQPDPLPLTAPSLLASAMEAETGMQGDTGGPSNICLDEEEEVEDEAAVHVELPPGALSPAPVPDREGDTGGAMLQSKLPEEEDEESRAHPVFLGAPPGASVEPSASQLPVEVQTGGLSSTLSSQMPAAMSFEAQVGGSSSSSSQVGLSFEAQCARNQPVTLLANGSVALQPLEGPSPHHWALRSSCLTMRQDSELGVGRPEACEAEPQPLATSSSYLRFFGLGGDAAPQDDRPAEAPAPVGQAPSTAYLRALGQDRESLEEEEAAGEGDLRSEGPPRSERHERVVKWLHDSAKAIGPLMTCGARKP